MALAALDVLQWQGAIVADGLATYAFIAGNFSTQISVGDPRYIAPSSTPTGASGAWVLVDFVGRALNVYSVAYEWGALFSSPSSALQSTIRRARVAGREEFTLLAGTDAFDAGSNGAGISLYGNFDAEHPGAIHVMTGPDDLGTSRLGISQSGIVVMGANVYGRTNEIHSGALASVGYLTIYDDWRGLGTDTKLCAFFETDASTSGSQGVMRAKLGLGWSENTQNLHSGEGVSLGYYSRLIDDTVPHLVAEAGIEKFNTDDMDRTSNYIIKVSADGIAAPVQRLRISGTDGRVLIGLLKMTDTPTYADNAAAIAGGLFAGDVYRTSTGTLMIRY